jgi:tetratricopeptide (TPR) repeat protein
MAIAVEMLREAQRLHPNDVWANLALGEALSHKPESRGEAIGFCRAALACRPNSFAIHVFLGHTLKEHGRPRQAAAVLRRAAELKPNSYRVHLLLGDVLVDLEKGPQALAEYRQAVQLIPTIGPNKQEADWFRQIQLLVEADDRLPAVLRREIQPRDASDRVELAFVCRLRKLEAASARLYGEAFDMQPDLAKQNRYYAAWAAVLAGIGQGKDAGALDEPEKARLRLKALGWLRDELVVWRERLVKGPAEARAEALQRIGCWLGDPDLACLRDPGPLGQLANAERGDWAKLWRDLRELRASAQSTK